MATILTYRNDDDRPLCEIALANGDRVQLQLSNAGLVIQQVGVGDQPSGILFKADVDLVADMCAAIMGGVDVAKTTPLDVLITVVSQIPSAAHVRESFSAAARAL